MSFLFPLGFAALVLILPLLLLIFWSWRREREILKAFLLKPNSKMLFVEIFIIIFFCIFTALTLARPTVVTQDNSRVYLKKNTEILLVLDVSKSMLAQKEPYSPTRFDRARDMALELVDKLNTKFGIAGFSNMVMPHILSTTDLESIKYQLTNNVIQVNSIPFGYNYGSGYIDDLIENYSKFFSSDAKHKIIVMFTDGDIPAPKNPRNNEFSADFFFVGIGADNELIYRYDSRGRLAGIDPHITNFREDVLRSSADIVNGTYISESEVNKLVSLIKDKLPSDEIVATEKERSWIELTPITALGMFIALCLFFYFRRPI